MRTTGDRTGPQISRRGFLGASAGVAAAAAVGLTGCGGSSGGSGSSSSSKNTLTVAVNGTQAAATAISQAVGPAFKQAHPGVTLNFMAINGTDWNDYFSKILTLIASGNPPDLTTVATEGLQLFAGKGLAQPLNSYVMSDKASLQGFFSDVHPVLIESMMYQGDLYVLPTDFNAGNMFFSTELLDRAASASAIRRTTGRRTTSTPWPRSGQAPPARWRGTGSCGCGGAGPPGCTPTTPTCSPRGAGPAAAGWWDTFYKNDPAAQGRQGGWHWGAPTANDANTVAALQYMIDLKNARLSASPDVGGGGTLQGLFASNHIAMTIGGGFWAGGLHTAGMSPTSFDVQYFPAWSTQKHLLGDAVRDAPVLQEQGAGLGVHEVADRAGRARRAGRREHQHADPPVDDDGQPVRPDRPGSLGGLLRHAGQFSQHHADPRAAVLPAAGHGLQQRDHPGDGQRQRQISAGRAANPAGRVRLELLHRQLRRAGIHGSGPAPGEDATGLQRRRETRFAWLLILPTVLFVAVFTASPIIASFVLSFYNYSVIKPAHWVGLANYDTLLHDSNARDAFGVTILLTGGIVIAEVVVGLALAVGVQRRMTARPIYRSAFFVPLLVSGASISIVMSYIFDPQFGVLNYYLHLLGLPQVPWLSSTWGAIATIMIVVTWQQLGFTFIVFSAALGAVPGSSSRRPGPTALAAGASSGRSPCR